MKPAIRLLATRRTIPKASDLPTIIPPISLYRQILRAHRHLPPDIRVLGDEYVKSEFKLHKSLDNAAQVIGFLTSWQHYLESLEGDKWKYQKLDMDKISRLDDNQMIQLYELMQAAKAEKSEYGDILVKNTTPGQQPSA